MVSKSDTQVESVADVQIDSNAVKCFIAGFGADTGPPPPCTCGRCQEHQELVCEGPQDQSYLPHIESV